MSNAAGANSNVKVLYPNNGFVIPDLDITVGNDWTAIPAEHLAEFKQLADQYGVRYQVKEEMSNDG
jgi:hypothetical protein